MVEEGSYAPNLDEPLEVTAEARKYNAWLFDRARPFLGRSVLDFGAGIGTFTELAARAQLDVVAVEPHPEFAARLRDRFEGMPNVTVVEGTDEASAGQAVDSIICFNVLEHIRDDAATLRRLRDRLVPGGRLLLLVPAHPVLFSAYDRSVGHQRRYRPAGVGALLQAAGYEVETLRYVNPAGALGWVLGYRLRPRRKNFPRTSYRVYDRLVPVLRPLDRLRLPFGLSVWAVARRPHEGA